MTDIQTFFEGFDVPAYARDAVPDGARMPYITYERVRPGPLGTATVRAWIWSRSRSFAQVEALRDAMADALSDGGVRLGGLCLFPETPFARAVDAVGADVRGVEVRMRAVEVGEGGNRN